jgi:HK97 gp10 family phage protein
MNTTVKVEGLKGLEDALAEFAPKLVKKAFRKATVAATDVQISAAKSLAPLLKKPSKYRYPGELRDSIGVNMTVGKRGSRARVGPRRVKGESNQSPGAWGLMVEFGSIHGPAQPYLRPAFDATTGQAVDAFADTLRTEIATIK